MSKDRNVRMNAIGNFLADNDGYDVISLQEVWSETDYQLIRKIAEKSLPFAHYFYRLAVTRHRNKIQIILTNHES